MLVFPDLGAPFNTTTVPVGAGGISITAEPISCGDPGSGTGGLGAHVTCHTETVNRIEKRADTWERVRLDRGWQDRYRQERN